ncbi:AraC-like DNA-binding protein [Chitinophaga niastensis]|uniref:AraC-like DNA-binding protein n=1 Tax=Chitinophaga niastensis TaxID=536980 RepID=A0A2P8HQ95_CHINA|nr:helix-turn-helix domain-containing protein [Chitinophaga niastensis]PSL48354.1 AraC-like DNA-binding protein [Chitinophaga niastensis]
MQPKQPTTNQEKILWIERDDNNFTSIETLPAEFLSMAFPYAKVYFRQDEDCDTLSQNIKLPGFSIWCHDIFALNDIILAPKTPHQILALHFMVADGIVADIFNRGEFLLGEKEVNLFNLHAAFHTAPVKAGNQICSFHINILPAALPDLIKQYPALQHLSTFEIGMVSGPLNKSPYKISAACKELITAIINCRFIEDQAKFFLRRCCADLYINFACQDRLSGVTNKMSPATKETLKEIFDHLVENVQEVFNIQRLAYLYELQITELNTGFEQLFFITPEAFAHQQKMMTAYRLITTTKERLGAIATETGFDNWHALKKAFEAYYGCTPASIRHAQ